MLGPVGKTEFPKVLENSISVFKGITKITLLKEPEKPPN